MAENVLYGIANPRGLALPPQDDELADNLKKLAETAEEAERYDDSCFYLKLIIAHKGDDVNNMKKLEQAERNLLSAAFKNVVGKLRQSSRLLREKKEEFQTDLEKEKEKKECNVDELNSFVKIATMYSEMVNEKVINKCQEVVELLVVCDKENKQKAHRKIKIPADPKCEDKETNEEAVFYLKMKGDYFRYMAEVNSDGKMRVDDEDVPFKTLAIQAYQQADEIAKKLTETSPIRLGLALNHSVCLFEITSEKIKARDVAQKAFNDAIQKLDQLNDKTYKDSTLIMQLLRDNLALWAKGAENPPTGIQNGTAEEGYD